MEETEGRSDAQNIKRIGSIMVAGFLLAGLIHVGYSLLYPPEGEIFGIGQDLFIGITYTLIAIINIPIWYYIVSVYRESDEK